MTPRLEQLAQSARRSVQVARIELAKSSLATRCRTTEPHLLGAVFRKRPVRSRFAWKAIQPTQCPRARFRSGSLAHARTLTGPELTKGLEPPTTALQGRCSTRLSYVSIDAPNNGWGPPVLSLLVDVSTTPARAAQRWPSQDDRRKLTEPAPHGLPPFRRQPLRGSGVPHSSLYFSRSLGHSS